MKLILVHPTGNSNTRFLLTGLIQKNRLHKFYTTIATYRGGWLYALGSVPFLADLRRRSVSSLHKGLLVLSPFFEVGRQLASKLKIKRLTYHETGFFSVDAVYQRLDQTVARQLSRLSERGVRAVYAYEDGALTTFKKAKQLGLLCIYELPIAYWSTSRELLQQEAERLPEWALTLGGGTQDSQQKLERKTQELALADLVVVPSQFVRDSLPASISGKQVVIAPFGTPTLSTSGRGPDSYTPENRPLRVLFAGSMGQRKGLGDLFEAVKQLNRADLELVVLGSLLAPMEFYRRQLPRFTYEPGRPNEQVLQLMRTCDVFCLPSIVEGRALVMQEAMSQGLPLLITPNTGGEDLILEGETGFLIPIRSPEAIAEKLTWFLENRSEIPRMGQLAQKHASRYTWEQYSNTIIEAIEHLAP